MKFPVQPIQFILECLFFQDEYGAVDRRIDDDEEEEIDNSVEDGQDSDVPILNVSEPDSPYALIDR